MDENRLQFISDFVTDREGKMVTLETKDVINLVKHIREQSTELERLREILKDMKSCDNCKHAFWKEYGFVCMRNFRNCKNNNMGHHEYNEPQSEV